MGELSLPLVGREDELCSLRALLADGEAARGRTAFLAGASGIGKTRLALWATDRASHRGWNVALGRAYPVETGVPYALFTDAFVPLLRRLDPSALAVLTRGASAELRQLFPSLYPLEAAPSDPTRGSSAELKARVLWNFAEFLGRLSARQPLLLVLENVQWADPSSLELLHFVARQIGDRRVVLLATYADEPEVAPSLRTAVQSLVSLGAATVRQVPVLPRTAVEELVRWRLASADVPAGALASRLYEWTRGHPFFLEEVLKTVRPSHADAVALEPDAESLSLPASVREALSARLARLSSGARRVAELAAVVGTRASHDVLRAVSDSSADALVGAIEELRREHVLHESANDGIVYDFSHPMIRDVVYEGLALARARQLHGRVAESLERMYGAHAGEHAGELGYHYARAGAGELEPKAVAYLVAAGRQALERGANREAVTALGTALDVVDRGGLPPAPITRASLLTDIARARQRLGEHDASRLLWCRARDAAAAEGDDARVATCERNLGLGAHWRGSYDAALAHYDRGLDAAERARDDAGAIRLRVSRGICLQALGRPAEGRAELERALEMASALGDPRLLARAHRTLLLYFLWAGETARARAHAEATLSLADRAAQPLLAWSAHWALAVLGGLTGKPADMARHLSACDDLVDVLRSPIARLWTAELHLHYHWATGDWDEAVAVGQRAISLARALQQQALLPRILSWSAVVLLGRGEVELAKRYLDEAWAMASGKDGTSRLADQLTLVQVYTGLTTYHTTLGAWRDAIESGEAGLALADRTGYVVWAVYRLMPALVEAYLRVVDLERASALAARLRTESERLGHPLGAAWADATDALVAPLRGDVEQSVDLLGRAVAALEAIPFVPDAARLRRELGRRRAQTGDREGALRDLRTAHELFGRLGARLEQEGAREQMRELGARPPSRVTASGVAGLTGRQLEIVRLVARRKSNKEIARQLRISPRTVSTHLSNIFGKLDVESRGELTDIVRAEGLDAAPSPRS